MINTYFLFLCYNDLIYRTGFVMRKFIVLAGSAMVAGMAYGTAFEDEVKIVSNLLAPDAAILDDILSIRESQWNASGYFTTLGYTPAQAGAAYADGDTFAEVEKLGFAGNIFRGIALNPDGTVIVQFTLGSDILTTNDKVYNSSFNARLRGHYVKFIPYQLRADQDDKVIVNDQSNHQQIHIGGWICETYAEGSLTTADYELFKAKDVIETVDGTMQERLVSFANQLPAPFNKCGNTNVY
jgi:hypothetical protein